MAVPTYVTNLDNAHLIAVGVHNRLDVAAEWRVQLFVYPIDPAQEAFLDTMQIGSRDAMALAAQSGNQFLASMVEGGFIRGGTCIMVPKQFEFRGTNAKFDSKYGLRFPTAEEVAEERTTRGI